MLGAAVSREVSVNLNDNWRQFLTKNEGIVNKYGRDMYLMEVVFRMYFPFYPKQGPNTKDLGNLPAGKDIY